MRIWEKFCTLSRARQIALTVFCLHLALIFSLSVHHLIHRRTAIKTKIAVRTVRPSAPMPMAQVVRSTAAPQKTAPKKVVAKGPAAPKESPKTFPVTSPVNETLLQEITENLEILNSKTVRSTRPTLSLPMSLPKSVQVEEEDDPDYGEILTAFLQSALDLPEYGEVKALLEIDARGQLTRLEILEEHNQKNGEFLKARLPELVFPSSGVAVSFTITFKNQT